MTSHFYREFFASLPLPSKYNPTITFVSAPCGSGKTHAAGVHIARNGHEINSVYVAPSIPLLRQTHETLLNLGIHPNNISLITQETHPNHVKPAIVEYLRKADADGNVLLITQQAYLDLPYFHRRERWLAFIDELPQVDEFRTYKVPRYYHLIAEHVEVATWVGETMAILRPKDAGQLRRLLEQPRDEVFEHFRPLFKDLVSPNYQVFADRDTLDKLAGKGFSREDDTQNRLYFLTMLNANLFTNSILLGANVEQSLLYHWLRRFHGKALGVNRDVKAGLRELPNVGHRLSIRYFLPRQFTKALRQRPSTIGELDVIGAMDAKAAEYFGAREYLVVTNNDRELLLPANAIRIPVASQGMNTYANVHNIYVSAALNRQTKHMAMLEQLGLDRDMIQIATAHETMYQAVMRTSLRDPAATDIVTAILPDRASAETVGRLTACQDIQQLGQVLKEPRKPLSGPQKRSRRIARQYMADMFPPILAPQSLSLKEYGINFGGSHEPQGRNDHIVCVTFHKTPYAEDAAECSEYAYGAQEFIKRFRQLSKAVVDRKDDLFMFQSATFRPPDGADGYRRQEYFHKSWFIALDFDNGKLSPEQFQTIFWRRPKRSFLIFNSFSRGAAEPNRFRVILFYKRPARSIGEHQAVFDAIERRLEMSGFPPHESGLDDNCRSGVLPLWVPSTNRAHQEWQFFKAVRTKTRELACHGIDPALCLRTVLFEPAVKPLVSRPLQSSHVSRQEIERIGNRVRAMKEDRHLAFFLAGKDLAKLGLSEHEIELELNGIAGTEKKMLRKVKYVIRSLRRYGHIQ